MSILEQYYGLNPVGVIDRNQWDLKSPELMLEFRNRSVYTPLLDWDGSSQQTGAITTEQFELLEGEADFNPIPLTANYIDAIGMDSRSRKWTVARYGDKVQLHKSSNYFNMWKMSGGRNWQPLLRALLANNVVQKTEALARNVWFQGSKTFWTYSGGVSNFSGLDGTKKFDISMVNQWNLRLGNTGSPIIPGDAASAKVAIVPPGAMYDFFANLPTATASEASLWRDAAVYGGQRLNYELGTYKGVRFVEAPNNKYGLNPNVLYNSGIITKQYGVTEPINMGDGAPDPETTAVDGVWYVGQKNATHYIQLENFNDGDFPVNSLVTIHVKRTNGYGITNGVDPFDGKTITRRVITQDHTNNRLTFDRPVMFNYTSAAAGTSDSGAAGTYYAYVTRAKNIGFGLVLGSRGAVQGKMHKPIEFYEPKPVDDFDSVWRFSWDMIAGYNIGDPNFFELFFFNTAVPTPGGVA